MARLHSTECTSQPGIDADLAEIPRRKAWPLRHAERFAHRHAQADHRCEPRCTPFSITAICFAEPTSAAHREVDIVLDDDVDPRVDVDGDVDVDPIVDLAR
jgi:hypothetical protein